MENEKKDYLVKETDGTQFIVYGAVIDAEELVEKMNNHSVIWLNLGGKVLAKNFIKSIEPVNVILKDEAEQQETTEENTKA